MSKRIKLTKLQLKAIKRKKIEQEIKRMDSEFKNIIQ